MNELITAIIRLAQAVEQNTGTLDLIDEKLRELLEERKDGK